MNIQNINIGDNITIELEGFGTFSAIAEKIEDDRVMFVFRTCVAERPMNESSTDGGFEASDLKKWMDTTLLSAFPIWMRNRICELTIPSYGMMFGHDKWYEIFEPDEDEQLYSMKIRKNRIAHLNDKHHVYWLSNKKADSSNNYARVWKKGGPCFRYDFHPAGVRPIFYLSKHECECDCEV